MWPRVSNIGASPMGADLVIVRWAGAPRGTRDASVAFVTWGKLLENGAQVRQHRLFFDKANQPWDSSV